MSFNAKKSGVKDARTELGLLQQWVSDCNARCAEVNTSFGAVMMGSWADAEISAAVQLQTYLLIYADALGAMRETYDSMIGDLDGTLSTRRDAVLESIKASTGNDDVVHFEDSGAVTAGCSTVQDALTALDTQRACAQGALAGLKRHDLLFAAVFALAGKAVFAGQVAVVRHMQAKGFQHALARFKALRHRLKCVFGKKAPFGFQRFNVVKAFVHFSGRHVAFAGVFFQNKLFDLVAALTFVAADNVVGHRVYGVHAAAVLVDDDVVAAKFICMNHVVLQKRRAAWPPRV